MKYKVYLEQEYNDFNGDLEPDWEVDCDPIMLDYVRVKAKFEGK